MRGSISIWDVLAWLALFGIVIWLILKMLGFISTPVLIEYAPIFGAVYLAGWSMSKLHTTTNDVRVMKSHLRHVERDIDIIKVSCPAFEKN